MLELGLIDLKIKIIIKILPPLVLEVREGESEVDHGRHFWTYENSGFFRCCISLCFLHLAGHSELLHTDTWIIFTYLFKEIDKLAFGNTSSELTRLCHPQENPFNLPISIEAYERDP